VKSFREYVTEALLEVDKQDINKLYAPYAKVMKELNGIWKKYGIDSIKYDLKMRRDMMGEFREILNRYPQVAPLDILTSADLKSDLAKKAHALNPVTIYIFLYGEGNFYNPQRKIIYLSLDMNICNSMQHALDTVPVGQLEMLRNEVSDVRIKSTIRHELSHWLDDTLHNFYMTKTFDKATNIKDAGGDYKGFVNKSLYKNLGDPYLAPVEITAMANQVAELKRRMSPSKYDKLTWVDLITLIPSLHFCDTRLGAEFRKRMISRLAREGLVGSNLTKKLT
jgi:hypothetical protein